MIIEYWIEEYQNYDLSSLPKITLDHKPLVLFSKVEQKKKAPFRFEYMWLNHKNFKDNLKYWWQIRVKGNAMFRLSQKLKEVK